VAHHVATGQELFEYKWVRAVGGALGFFLRGGLGVDDKGDGYSSGDVAVALSVRPSFAKATAG
jgi:hypothetical protein